MQSERIYKTNPYKKFNPAIVTSVIEKDGNDVISCNRSIFFPEGGGQPSDFGKVSLGEKSFNITSCYDEGPDSDVFHVTDAPSGSFSVGDEVFLEIDWKYRFQNMQRHCGEHMFSAAFYSLYHGTNRGFHMGSDYITIDIETGDGRLLTEDEIQTAANSVNAAIRANLPVEVKYFESYEDSRIMPVRKDVPHDGEVSVVTIGYPAGYYDCIACCGTHPRTSAEVGLLAVYKSEPNKGMTRIYFDCGSMALNKLCHDYDILNGIAISMSTSIEDLPRRLKLIEEKDEELKARLTALSAYAKEVESERIKSGIADARSKDEKVFKFAYDLFSTDELLKLGFEVYGDLRSEELLILRDSNSNVVLLFSDGSVHKCGELVKARAKDFGGRGGGRNDNARAAFCSAKDAKSFVASFE